MHLHTFLEIKSIGILLFFSSLLMYKLQSIFRLYKHNNLLHKNKTVKKLKRLSWDDFEQLTMELFSKMGWKVHGNEKKGADGGVDIWMEKKSLTKKNISAIVQCKRYDDTLVTIKVIREMFGLMHEYEVDEVYVVTTSKFTKECYQFIKGKKIILIDGTALEKLIIKCV